MTQSRPTIFVVDDDEDIRQLLRTIAEIGGLDIKVYDSAETFWIAYHSSQPQCLVLDVQLPGISGLDLLERLVACKANFPVIMMSGYADVATAVQAMRLGAKDFFQKPFNIQLLLRRIRQVIEQDDKPDEQKHGLSGKVLYGSQSGDVGVAQKRRVY